MNKTVTKILPMSYAAAYAEANEKSRRNYRNRVAIGFFFLALIGFVSTLYGDIPVEMAYIWISAVLIAYPTVWLLEKMADERLASTVMDADVVADSENESPAAIEEIPAEGTLEHHIRECDDSELRYLKDAETPEGMIDYLLIKRDGAILTVRRSSCWNRLGSHSSGEDWAKVQMEADGILGDAERVKGVLARVPGIPPRIYPVLLLPSGSFENQSEFIKGVYAVPEDLFESVTEEQCLGGGENNVIWKDYKYLRSLIRG